MSNPTKPTNGQAYFYVNDQGKIGESQWMGDEQDQNRLRFGNVFTQRSEAQEHLKTISKLETRQMAGSKS